MGKGEAAQGGGGKLSSNICSGMPAVSGSWLEGQEDRSTRKGRNYKPT
jgi:hypothetical protein